MCLAFVLYPELGAAAELRLLSITVNETSSDVVAPVVIDDAKLYLAAETFERLRIRLPDGPALRHQGGTYFPLNAHGGSSYRIDDRSQALFLSVPAPHMQPTVLGSYEVPYIAPSNSAPGGFLNYDLFYEHVSGEDELANVIEVGAFAGAYVATSNQTFRNLDEDPEAVRLDTTLTRDFPEQRLTLRWGDSISRGGAWGRPVRFGGLQMGSNFATQPHFISFPTVGLSADAALPSSVDVLINDTERFSEDVPSGPFSIDELPIVTGAGEVTAVVTDILGRETTITQPYYISPSLLRRGVHDFSFETGLLRDEFGVESYDYEDTPFFSGTYRYGFNDIWTGETHGELDGERQALGFASTVPLGYLGVLNGAVAGSIEEDGEGGLVQLGFERLSRDFSIATFGRLTRGAYSDFGVADSVRSPDGEARIRLGLPLGRDWGSFTSSYSYRAFGGGADDHVATAGYSVRLGDFASLSFTGLARFGSGDEALLSVGLFIPLGPRSHVSARHQVADNQKPFKSFEARATPPLEGGFGTAISVSDDSVTRGRIELSHVSSYGIVSAAGSKAGEDEGARLNAVGGLVLGDGQLFASRRINESFAIVSVPGQEGVRVYSENRLIGETDSSGRLLLHNLRAYEANRIGIEPKDLPVTAEIETVKNVVAPRFRSGVTVDFPVDDARPVLVSIRRPDGSPVPAGATVSLAGGVRTFLVGYDGEVMLRGVKFGETLSVEYAGGGCAFVIDREIPNDALPRLGQFLCEAR